MGVRFPSVATTTSVGVLPATGAETVVATTPPLNIPLDFAQVLLFWWFVGNTGAGTVGLVASIRRGDGGGYHAAAEYPPGLRTDHHPLVC